MFWKKKSPRPREHDALRLDLGWTEVWEEGRYLGLFDCLGCLEQWVQARPGRRFRLRIVGRPLGCRVVFLRPMARLEMSAGKRSPVYHAVDQ